MMHSSAFDDHHAIPTTPEITKAAISSVFRGRKEFPAHKGLSIEQLTGAVIALGLNPLVLGADRQVERANYILSGFSAARFSNLCASFIRSGYPVLLAGVYYSQNNSAGHAVCASGFRDIPHSTNNHSDLIDSEFESIYIHDDNIGPNVRFIFYEKDFGSVKLAAIKPKEPPYINESERAGLAGYPECFIPNAIVVAVHNEIKLDPDMFLTYGRNIKKLLQDILDTIFSSNNLPTRKVVHGCRLTLLSDYFKDLNCGNLPVNILSKVRLELQEEVTPMSKFIGVIRFGVISDRLEISLELLIDTTETSPDSNAFAHIIYSPKLKTFLDTVYQNAPAVRNNIFGTEICAF